MEGNLEDLVEVIVEARSREGTPAREEESRERDRRRARWRLDGTEYYSDEDEDEERGCCGRAFHKVRKRGRKYLCAGGCSRLDVLLLGATVVLGTLGGLLGFGVIKI